MICVGPHSNLCWAAGGPVSGPQAVQAHFRVTDTNMLKVKECKKVFHAKSNQKRAGMVTIISGTIEFKTKTAIRNRDYHIMMKRLIHQKT